MSNLTKPIAMTVIAAGISSLCTLQSAYAEDQFMTALTGGKVSFSARARYENVEQDGKQDADGLTLRTTLGYTTADFHGFGAKIEFEDVSEIGMDDYNSKTNGKTAYAVIADPEDTEVNQAYLSYKGFDTEFKLGRQEITYRQAPFHRFVGNVLWRQNHQSFDAFSFTNKSLADTTINYAYINKVKTILGGDVDMNSHLFNVQYTGLPVGKLEAYGYLLDYDDKPATSSKTFGLRLSGAQPVSEAVKVIYTAEVANQSDYKDGSMDDQNYYLAELGAKYKGWVAKLSYELQEGDGTDSFKTPLGTNHAYQGWGDLFLETPSTGLQDTYFTVAGKVWGTKLVAVYHDFETDQGSLDAGSELDLLAQKTFNEHYTLGVKYADYNGDTEFAKPDTKKFWLYGQVKF